MKSCLIVIEQVYCRCMLSNWSINSKNDRATFYLLATVLILLFVGALMTIFITCFLFDKLIDPVVWICIKVPKIVEAVRQDIQ